MEKIKMLGISGSLRKKSYNTAALKAMIDVLPDTAQMQIADLTDIPFFNQDVEDAGEPDAVKAFKRSIANADALVIAAPEYNYSMPAVLKNALDWASRGTNALKDKPLAILSASISMFGGVRVQYHIRQTCVGVGLIPLNSPQVFLSQADTLFDDSGNLIDESKKLLLKKLGSALIEWTIRLKE